MSVTEKQKQADWHDHLAREREILQPTVVELGDVPNWFRRRLMKVFGNARGLRGGEAVLNRAVEAHFENSDWLDHWGSTESGKVFVSEPYELTPKSVALIESFGCRHRKAARELPPCSGSSQAVRGPT